jgi:maltooligosyltrehalose trehalohydrolase
MHRFSIWAPRASSVAIAVNGLRHPMTAADHGWWQVDVVEAQHGTDYAYYIDDDTKPYPDPRSEWQPNGVHAASRVIDHSRFQWRTTGFSAKPLSQAIIYELHIGTFTTEGTFAAAIEKLPYLRDFGITHVEVMPVNSFPGRWGWGYDGVAIYAPQEAYGGPHGLKEFVDACHWHGMAALLDVVYNHFGPVGNYSGKFAPYITECHHTPWGGAVNLEEAGSYEVRRFFCDNAKMWLHDYRFDGLRLDAVHAFIDGSARHFLEQLADEVQDLSAQLDRKLVLIAESDLNDPRIVAPKAIGGYGIDAQWSDDFHHALFTLLTGERRSYYSDFGSLAQLATSLRSVFIYDGIYSEFREREHGRRVVDLTGDHFVICIQNHDQIGNRAFGDRIATVAGVRKAKLAAAMVLTAPFVPLLFQGEEFAASSPFLYFADHEDPELARAVSDGRRREHASDGAWDSIPDPESYETFERSKLDWREPQQRDHATMLDWYSKLIKLRQSQPALRNFCLDNVQVQFDEASKWLTMKRGDMLMLFNFGEDAVTLSISAGARLLLASEPEIRIVPPELVLPPESFAALVNHDGHDGQDGGARTKDA